MDCGDTFLMPVPGGSVKPHLWIVITRPDPVAGECLIVSLTTLRNSKDQTVLLQVGDHPFIRHASTIFYGDAMIIEAARLEAEIRAGLASPHEKCSPETLKLVRDGLAASPFTRPKVLRFFKEHSGV